MAASWLDDVDVAPCGVAFGVYLGLIRGQRDRQRDIGGTKARGCRLAPSSGGELGIAPFWRASIVLRSMCIDLQHGFGMLGLSPKTYLFTYD